MTLRAMLLIPVLLVSALAVALLFGFWMPARQLEAEGELRVSAERHLASVAEGCVPLLLARELDTLYENLDALKRRNTDWVEIELVAPNGWVIYPLTPSADVLTTAANERIVRQPITYLDQPLGTLVAKIDVAPRLAELWLRHEQVLIALVLVVVAYVGLVWLVLERWVRRPLRVLADASKRLAAGDFATPLVRAASTEVAGVVDSFVAMRESIRKYQYDLAQAQKMEALGTLAGGIAHDFNNILSPIIAYTELAREAAGGNPELTADLAEVSKAATRARDLAAQILTFSRRSEPTKVPASITAIAAEALKLLRSSIPSSIEFQQRIEGKAVVLADPSQLHQVVVNLCTNAFHAMEAKGGVLTVTVEEVEVARGQMAGVELTPGRYALLSVSDTGTGIDRETITWIFDPYFTTKPTGKGTGLGLAVVDGIVRGAGGRISVYSEVGVGTTFRVYLPLASPACDTGPSSSEPAPPERAMGKERVLFVDDEEQIRESSRRFLGKLGYRVAVFSNGEDALEAFRRDPTAWDVLVTDMTMPGLSGKDLARKAMELRPGLPVILCCGFSSLIDARAAKKLGIREYLAKPLDLHDLHRAIGRVVVADPA
jgi:signal transduction histidine kinase/ActR/RegA family two-component response regulator